MLEDVGLAAIGAVRVAACLALVAVGWRFGRGVIVWLGTLAIAATVPYVIAAVGWYLSPTVIAASGVINTALVVTCLWAAIDSQGAREALQERA